MIKGKTVLLHKKTLSGYNSFKEPIYTETTVSVDNVLYAPVSSNEILNDATLSGRKAVYQIAIPKGDTNDWKDVLVEFEGQTFKTFGEPIKGIDENIPLQWNTKVYCDIYEKV